MLRHIDAGDEVAHEPAHEKQHDDVGRLHPTIYIGHGSRFDRLDLEAASFMCAESGKA